MIARKIKQFLDENDVKYVTITHSAAYTAQEIAASVHVPGKDVAKSVMVNIEGVMAMVVLPASKRVSFDVLRAIVGKDVELAHEADFARFFPDCEVGAMPPFGNLYGLDVYVDPTLTEDEEIVFNAGTHIEVIRMAYSDFERLAQPRIMEVAIS